jgi:hypothetical protein
VKRKTWLGHLVRTVVPGKNDELRFITGADLLMDGEVTAALRTGELTMSPAPTS